MNKVEMTLREVYDEVLLDIYNNAVESIKFVSEAELKKELVVNYIKSLNIILLNGLIDDDVTVNDFNYLVSQVNDLANELLKYIKDEYISKSKLKKVVYNFIYGQINTSMLDQMEKHNIKVSVYWHYGWCQPVVYIPQFCDYIDVLYQLGDDLGVVLL